MVRNMSSHVAAPSHRPTDSNRAAFPVTHSFILRVWFARLDLGPVVPWRPALREVTSNSFGEMTLVAGKIIQISRKSEHYLRTGTPVP